MFNNVIPLLLASAYDNAIVVQFGGSKMHRISLSSLSVDDRLMLANLIQEYVTPSVISVHWDAALSGVHSDPVSFLSFHRSYIAGLKTFLEGKPGEARGTFCLPLPVFV